MKEKKEEVKETVEKICKNCKSTDVFVAKQLGFHMLIQQCHTCGKSYGIAHL